MKKAFLLVAMLACAGVAQTSPDLILVNGKVFVPDSPAAFAQAVAITGTQITAVGTTEAIVALAGPNTVKRDLRGHLVIPGINDAHVHFATNPAGFTLATDPGSTFDQVKAAVAGAADETPGDFWIFGEIGPGVLGDPNATAAGLDAVAAGHRVMLMEFTGHGAIFSTAALTALDATAPADPLGGFFERNANGALTGKAFEYAEYGLLRKLADMPDDVENTDNLRALNDQALAFGITTLQVMPWMAPRRFASIVQKASPAARIRIMRIPITDRAELHTADNRAESITAVKWLLDGTPVERGAALRQPYSSSSLKGRLNFTEQQIKAMLDDAVSHNEQPLLHAVGDRTIATLLSVMTSMNRSDWPSRHVRIEHGDGLQPDLIPIAKMLGVTVVQNPTHFVARSFYPAGNYLLLKTLLDKGVHLAFGSDGPLNPFLNIQQAILHPGVPSEAVSVAEAINVYTAGSAYAEKVDNKGTIARNQLADLAVLSDDLFTMRPDAMPETRSILTIVGGRIVYDAGVLPH